MAYKTKGLCDTVAEYEFDYWKHRLEAVPTKRLAYVDFGQAYETENMAVYKLDDGKYATIHQSGCSCYSSNDAEIEIFTSKAKALESFNSYKKATKLYRHEND